MMIDDVLKLFPSHTHPLTLVSDPDRLLAAESVMQGLAQHQFTIIEEKDAVLLRHRIEENRPFSGQHPLIIITQTALEELPYDVFQNAYLIRLTLHNFFPNLSYPILQALTPAQVQILAQKPAPLQPLSRKKTMEYVLENVFRADVAQFSQPPVLIAWLTAYHQDQNLLPQELRTFLVEMLKRLPIYSSWDLDALLRSADSFKAFIQNQWCYSIQQMTTGKEVHELAVDYLVSFAEDARLQDLLPTLVRHGTLQPLEMPDHALLPGWTYAGISRMDTRLQRFTNLLEEMESRLAAMHADPVPSLDWSDWSVVADTWADIHGLADAPDLTLARTQKSRLKKVQHELDCIFSAWLKSNYAPLAVQRLPQPHHVHHIPHYLAYQHQSGALERFVLFILDGLSMCDWKIIHTAWASRHPDWEMHTRAVLAQIPSLTSISRMALISGMRPKDFLSDPSAMSDNRAWQLFWSREGVQESACKCLNLNYDRNLDQQPDLLDNRVRHFCLIDDTFDNLAHHASLGSKSHIASLKVWLDTAQPHNSLALEQIISDFLTRGFSIYFASDHGHVEAFGFGQPSEGLLAQTRGKRARIYPNRQAALSVQAEYPKTMLWGNDGLLPEGMSVLMPSERNAFALQGELIVTHGGTCIEELVVPFVHLTKSRT